MIEAIGSKVLKLVRVAIGDVVIGDLEIGKWRKLEPEEIAALNRAGAAVSNRKQGIQERERRAPQ